MKDEMLNCLRLIHAAYDEDGADLSAWPEKAADALEAQQAEIESLRVDAERYRWMREQNIVDWDAFPYPPGYEHPDDALDSYQMMLDAAIDAARRK